MSYDANLLLQRLRVGTSRAAGATQAALPAGLAALLPAPDGCSAEARLWLSLGALALWQRAGHVPAAQAASTTPVCAREALPACPPSAASILQLILQGVHNNLLPEWLHRLKRRGAVLPDRLLPALLDLATRQTALRAPVTACAGTRALWLARLNSQWAWLAGSGAPEQRTSIWQTGSLEERKLVLAEWRAGDAAGARDALLDVWRSEPPEHRAALLPCLLTKLGPADEAFLETALDDRRKEVRQAAQKLLAQLPGSALSQRMLGRLAPRLVLEKPLLRARRLNISLPPENDAAMQRDGVGATSHPGLGEKAGWLVDMLAAVDPSHWSAQFGATPAECLALAVATDFQQALLRGWVLSLQNRLALAATPALLAWLGDLSAMWIASPDLRGYYPSVFFASFAALPAAEEHALLARLVQASPRRWGKDGSAVVELLFQLAAVSSSQWPAALSRTIVERLFASLDGLPADQWTFRPIFPTLALVLDPGAVAAFEQDWGGLRESEGAWRASTDKFFSIVRFRHEMSRSFQEHA